MVIIIYKIDIYANGPKPYIATLPDPNNERLVFESIDPYIPVLGVTGVDGIPNDTNTPGISPVLAVVTAAFAATVPPDITNASVFAEI
jgi:hypothetical protein